MLNKFSSHSSWWKKEGKTRRTSKGCQWELELGRSVFSFIHSISVAYMSLVFSSFLPERMPFKPALKHSPSQWSVCKKKKNWQLPILNPQEMGVKTHVSRSTSWALNKARWCNSRYMGDTQCARSYMWHVRLSGPSTIGTVSTGGVFLKLILFSNRAYLMLFVTIDNEWGWIDRQIWVWGRWYDDQVWCPFGVKVVLEDRPGVWW